MMSDQPDPKSAKSIFELRDLISRHGGRGQLNVVPPGRPYFVAHIPGPCEFEELELKYYDVIRGLSYREAMAWCRGFGYSYSTYLMRRYVHRRPRLEEVILTLGWYQDGKPVQRKNRTSVASVDRLLAGLKELTARGTQP